MFPSVAETRFIIAIPTVVFPLRSPVAKLKAQIPPHAVNDHVVGKPAVAKKRVTG